MSGNVTRWQCRLCLAFAAALPLPAYGQEPPTRLAPAKVASPVVQPADVGLATVYDATLEGQLTASGEPYRAEDLTAAHRGYPLGTRLRVTGVRSGNAITVRVNDRWGGGAGRIINLSGRAARELGFGSSRTMEVRIEVAELGAGTSVQREARTTRETSAMTVVAAPKPMSRGAECADQAKILGLEGDWAERHTRACLANRPKK